jgi:NhaA family Na+:H+ antiporter
LITSGALLTGIGFTMSLLIAELVLAHDQLDSAKLGIPCASVLAAVSGLPVLTWLTGGHQRRGSVEPELAVDRVTNDA